jgi:hypothetical protein
MAEFASHRQEVDCVEGGVEAAATLDMYLSKSLVEVPDRSWVKPELSQ